MSEEMPEPPRLPEVLDYGTPPRAQNRAAVAQFAIGFIASTFVLAVVSAAIILNVYPIGGPPGSPPPRRLAPPILYVALAITAFATTRYVWRKRPGGRWFFLGLLIGVGVTALLEGACFAAN